MSSMAVKIIVQKILELLTDFEGTIKKTVMSVLAVITVIVLVFSIPTILLVSIPTIFLNASKDEAVIEGQIKVVELYVESQSNNEALSEWVDRWIEREKEQYTDCDEIFVSKNINITWQDLMAVDTILIKQDFSEVTKQSILELSKDFLKKGSNKEYVRLSRQGDAIKNEDGEIIGYETEYYYEWHAFINVTPKSLDEVTDDFDFSESDKAICGNYSDFLMEIDLEFQNESYDDGEFYFTKNGNARIGYYSQNDSRWSGKSYGNTTISKGGCGPTALAMVVSSLTDMQVYPDQMANWAYQNGYRVEGAGSAWSLMKEGAASWGLDVAQISKQDFGGIINALQSNQPIIAIMGEGTFTKSGHFIVLAGIENGKIIVNDPNSVDKSNQLWELSLILQESKGGFWTYTKNEAGD